MSKAATLHLMKQIMTYLVPQGITANTVSPGGEFGSRHARRLVSLLTAYYSNKSS
jgi:NAD(P)-dependent dehydrogenase (short-subunit alcohol dehydrogenase family)